MHGVPIGRSVLLKGQSLYSQQQQQQHSFTSQQSSNKATASQQQQQFHPVPPSHPAFHPQPPRNISSAPSSEPFNKHLPNGSHHKQQQQQPPQLLIASPPFSPAYPAQYGSRQEQKDRGLAASHPTPAQRTWNTLGVYERLNLLEAAMAQALPASINGIQIQAPAPVPQVQTNGGPIQGSSSGAADMSEVSEG